MKALGILICVFFIVIGSFLLPFKGSQEDVPYNGVFNEIVIDEVNVRNTEIHGEPLIKAIIDLRAALEVKSDELRVTFEDLVKAIGTEGSKNDYKEVLIQYEKQKASDENIKLLMSDIENYISFKKKIDTANVFFQHVLKLIFILSGIFGLFWISIWKFREDREKRDSAEKKWIQQCESVEREKEVMAGERLKVLELSSKNKTGKKGSDKNDGK
jgi:hypothetical protein